MESLFEEQIKLGGPVSVFDLFIVVFSVIVFLLSLLLARHYKRAQSANQDSALTMCNR